MCNLVTLNSTVDEVASYFKSRRPQATNASPGDVYPGGQGFVVRQDGGERVLQAMTWGFPVRLKHMKPTSKPKPVNNARDDKLMSFWRPWFTSPAHRCLIPFTSFAEGQQLQIVFQPVGDPVEQPGTLGWRYLGPLILGRVRRIESALDIFRS